MKALYYATAKIDGRYPVFPVTRVNGRLTEGKPIAAYRTWGAAMNATARLNGCSDG